MAEWSAVAQQVVNPGETIIFNTTAVPCYRGLVRHRDDSGDFSLSGVVNQFSCCPCQRQDFVNYLVDFGANIAIPTDGTAGAISVAIAINGSTLPASIMTVTPAAVNQFFNVSRAINVPILANCCQPVSVRNISSQPILVQNANIIISRPA